MGAWGEGPMDSDGALDWLGNYVTDPVGARVSKLLAVVEARDGHVVAAEEVRAAAWVVLRLNFFREELRLHERLATALMVLREDEDWMLGWSDPEAVRRALTREIKALEAGPRPTSLVESLGDALEFYESPETPADG